MYEATSVSLNIWLHMGGMKMDCNLKTLANVCVLEKSPKSPILGEYVKGVVVSIIYWFPLNFVVMCDIAWWVVAPDTVAMDTICA